MLQATAHIQRHTRQFTLPSVTIYSQKISLTTGLTVQILRIYISSSLVSTYIINIHQSIILTPAHQSLAFAYCDE